MRAPFVNPVRVYWISGSVSYDVCVIIRVCVSKWCIYVPRLCCTKWGEYTDTNYDTHTHTTFYVHAHHFHVHTQRFTNGVPYNEGTDKWECGQALSALKKIAVIIQMNKIVHLSVMTTPILRFTFFWQWRKHADAAFKRVHTLLVFTCARAGVWHFPWRARFSTAFGK